MILALSVPFQTDMASVSLDRPTSHFSHIMDTDPSEPNSRASSFSPTFDHQAVTQPTRMLRPVLLSTSSTSSTSSTHGPKRSVSAQYMDPQLLYPTTTTSTTPPIPSDDIPSRSISGPACLPSAERQQQLQQQLLRRQQQKQRQQQSSPPGVHYRPLEDSHRCTISTTNEVHYDTLERPQPPRTLSPMHNRQQRAHNHRSSAAETCAVGRSRSSPATVSRHPVSPNGLYSGYGDTDQLRRHHTANSTISSTTSEDPYHGYGHGSHFLRSRSTDNITPTVPEYEKIPSLKLSKHHQKNYENPRNSVQQQNWESHVEYHHGNNNGKEYDDGEDDDTCWPTTALHTHDGEREQPIWFHGKLTRKQAEKRLILGGGGHSQSWLVREKDRNTHVISIMTNPPNAAPGYNNPYDDNQTSIFAHYKVERMVATTGIPFYRVQDKSLWMCQSLPDVINVLRQDPMTSRVITGHNRPMLLGPPCCYHEDMVRSSIAP